MKLAKCRLVRPQKSLDTPSGPLWRFLGITKFLPLLILLKNCVKRSPRVIETVGTLILAKQRGILPTIKPMLQNLDDTGFYVSAALKEEALRLAEE